MSEKIEQNESKKIEVLFGRELDIKGQFKDRLIHQHLKRERKNCLLDLDELSEDSSSDDYDV